MTLWDFLDRHPFFALIALFLVCLTGESISQHLGRKP